MSEPLYLALDIGGTKSAVIVGTAAPQILDRIQFPSNAQTGPATMIDQIIRHAQTLIQKHPGIVAVGVSIGGPLDADNGVIQSPPNLPGWDNTPLKQILQERLNLPVKIEHDAAACCLAEFTWGAGRGSSRLVYLTSGTGFGAGLVLDGKIYRGANGKSLEIGHARFREAGPEAFNKAGSIEAFCAGASLGKIATWKFPHRWPTHPSSQELAALWRAGDPEATEVIRINAHATGEVCATIADFLRPDTILLGSLALHLGDSWINMVKEKYTAESLPDTPARIAPASLADKLQDYSALVVAMSEQKMNRR